VSSITIGNYLKKCGIKEIGEKGYKFFTENYMHNVFVKEEDDRAGTRGVKGRCYRSRKKSEAPHRVKLKIADREGRGNVEKAEYSCKAGEYNR